jgi:glyoxylase-like metal-dependent hydrolase (beta-lactamase superfamily II)/ferredoxin
LRAEAPFERPANALSELSRVLSRLSNSGSGEIQIMAALAKRLLTNAPGEFFVDATCIDCDTCNWVAPDAFDDGGDGHSRVHTQPGDAAGRLRAEMALLACPVGAIGTRTKHDLAAARASFPERVEDEVYHLGYHAEASFGAASYLVRRPEGNVLVDSPRFTAPVVTALERAGGVKYMFLTHQDDVADHAKFRARFGCERILHADDVTHGTREVEIKIAGRDPVALAPDLRIIPVPGHTRGSACLLVDETFLLSGDHVAWSPERRQIYAFRDACWYDWQELRRSMARLAEHRFEWILPGHGRRCHFPAPQMKAEMLRCVEWMARA